jgi:ribose/xylose/arabinose/galactoside ABC-type transport system permease subunit
MKRHLSIIAILVGLCIINSILSPVFFSPANFTNILLQSSINIVLALGLTFVIVAGGIDLSVGSLLALCNVVLALVAKSTGSIFLGIFASIATGLLFGAINGLVVSRGKVPSFIATLGMLLVARGIAYVIADGQTIYLGVGPLAGKMIPLIITAGTVGISLFILSGSRFGRYVYASGGNQIATWISGINVKGITSGVFIISGACAGLGGIIYWARLGAGSPLGAESYELYAIAAVILGGTSLSGGRGSVVGTILGALIMAVLYNGLSLQSVPEYWQKVVIGSVIVLAVMVDQLKNSDERFSK